MLNLDLLSKVREITASGLPFMDGKEKLELANGSTFIVRHFGFLEGDNGDFVVIADDNYYAFGGSIVTEAFKKLEGALSEQEIEQLLNAGLPVKIAKKKSKGGRQYTSCEFFPKEEMQTR
jgi:hypothetical protein